MLTTRGWMPLILALGFTAILAANAAAQHEESEGRESKQEKVQKVAVKDLPPAVRATLDREFPGAKIKMIEREEDSGKVIYDVEAKLKGAHVEMDIAVDGSVLTREESVAYASLPAVVRAAVEQYFGRPGKYEAAKEVENGKIFYEVEGKKSGEKVSLKVSEDGQKIEPEKE